MSSLRLWGFRPAGSLLIAVEVVANPRESPVTSQHNHFAGTHRNGKDIALLAANRKAPARAQCKNSTAQEPISKYCLQIHCPPRLQYNPVAELCKTSSLRTRAGQHRTKQCLHSTVMRGNNDVHSRSLIKCSKQGNNSKTSNRRWPNLTKPRWLQRPTIHFIALTTVSLTFGLATGLRVVNHIRNCANSAARRGCIRTDIAASSHWSILGLSRSSIHQKLCKSKEPEASVLADRWIFPDAELLGDEVYCTDPRCLPTWLCRSRLIDAIMQEPKQVNVHAIITSTTEYTDWYEVQSQRHSTKFHKCTEE